MASAIVSTVSTADDRRCAGFDVVLPEELIRRMVANTGGKQQCPMPSGRWADEAGNLPKCWLPGDGSCIFECTRILELPL